MVHKIKPYQFLICRLIPNDAKTRYHIDLVIPQYGAMLANLNFPVFGNVDSVLALSGHISLGPET